MTECKWVCLNTANSTDCEGVAPSLFTMSIRVGYFMFQCCSLFPYTTLLLYVSPFLLYLVSYLSSSSLIHHYVCIFKRIPLSLMYNYVLTTVSLISPIFPHRFDTFRSSFWFMILNHCFCILTHWLHEPTILGLVDPSQSINYQQFSILGCDQAAQMYPIRW
jgi:hypothetical protein